MTPHILLFDIDGTLLTAGGAGRRSLEDTFEAAYGDPDCLSFSFAGMTDRLIMRRALDALGEPCQKDTVDRLLDDYVRRLSSHVESTPKYRVYDGVRTLLDAAQSWSNTAIGLGTGNIERGARIKLGPAGLNEYFSFGGFGCDAEDRAELIRAGAQRGASRLGATLQRCRVVVLGDTTRDVEAAHAIGAECIGVATGGTTGDGLARAGADWTVETLSDPRIPGWLRRHD